MISGFFNTLGNNLGAYASSGGAPCDQRHYASYSAASTISVAFGRGYMRNDETGISPFGFDDFQQFYSWLPGNIFEGPNGDQRTDDPSEEFEHNAATVVGTARANLLRQTYEDMRIYILSDGGEISALRRAGAGLAQIAQMRGITPLGSFDWERDGSTPDGRPKYRLKKLDGYFPEPNMKEVVNGSDTCMDIKPRFEAMKMEYLHPATILFLN
jgi:hypothetical protein